MKYNIINRINNPDGSRVEKIKDIFKVEGLNIEISLTIEELQFVLDKHLKVPKITVLEIESTLFSLMMESVGVSEDTPVESVMAMSYIILSTPNFSFSHLCAKIALAIHIDQTFNFVVSENVKVPNEFIYSLQERLSDSKLFALLLERNKLTVTSTYSNEEFVEFLDLVAANIETSGRGNATNNFLAGLGISTSDE